MLDEQQAPQPHRIEMNTSDIALTISPAAKRRKAQNRINARAYRKRRSLMIKGVTPQVVQCKKIPSDQAIGHVSGERLLFTQAVDHWLCSLSNPMGFPHADLLLSMVSLNVFRAFETNVKTVGWKLADLENEQALSIFDTDFDDTALPVALKPTRLQRSIPHHPVYDAFPDPQFRDQILLVPELMEAEDLCLHLSGFAPPSTSEPQGLIVWGEPYLLSSWEVSEPFYRKWCSLLAGCEGLVDSTNRWRARRGEEPLNLQGSACPV